MTLEFTTFGEVTITPQYGSYNCKLVLSEVDESEVIRQIPVNSALADFNINDIINYVKEQGYAVTE